MIDSKLWGENWLRVCEIEIERRVGLLENFMDARRVLHGIYRARWEILGPGRPHSNVWRGRVVAGGVPSPHHSRQHLKHVSSSHVRIKGV